MNPGLTTGSDSAPIQLPMPLQKMAKPYDSQIGNTVDILRDISAAQKRKIPADFWFCSVLRG
jgi:hypothetical protein